MFFSTYRSKKQRSELQSDSENDDGDKNQDDDSIIDDAQDIAPSSQDIAPSSGRSNEDIVKDAKVSGLESDEQIQEDSDDEELFDFSKTRVVEEAVVSKKTAQAGPSTGRAPTGTPTPKSTCALNNPLLKRDRK